MRSRRGRAKPNPAALHRREWHAFVRRTLMGMVPTLLNGCLFAYRIAWGTAFTTSKLREYFAGVAPQRYWPAWMRETR
jgi:hypothetical protein